MKTCFNEVNPELEEKMSVSLLQHLFASISINSFSWICLFFNINMLALSEVKLNSPVSANAVLVKGFLT